MVPAFRSSPCIHSSIHTNPNILNNSCRKWTRDAVTVCKSGRVGEMDQNKWIEDTWYDLTLQLSPEFLSFTPTSRDLRQSPPPSLPCRSEQLYSRPMDKQMKKNDRRPWQQLSTGWTHKHQGWQSTYYLFFKHLESSW